MLLSDFYKTNTKEGKLDSTTDPSKYVYLTCSDFLNNLPEHELDNSMFMTMCIDSTYNYLYGIEFTENNTGFKIETKQKACDFNATVMTVSNPANEALYRPKFYDNKFMDSSKLCIMNSVGQSYYLHPVIFAIDKSDFVFYKNQQGIDTNKIKRITLKELYINKDKYYVVSCGSHLVYVSNTSNYYSSFITPTIWKGNNDEIYGAPVGNLTAHAHQTSINNPSISIIGYNKEIRPSSSGGSPFLLNYPHTIKEDTIQYSNTDYGNVEIQYTFNNQCEFFETHTGVWKIQSHTNDSTGYKYANGVYVMKSDFVLKHIAMTGGYVVWDSTNYNSVVKPVSSNAHIAICEMNENGFLTGDFIVPEMKDYYTGANKETIKYNETFNPSNYPVSNKDIIEPPKYRITDQIGGFTLYYKCTQSDLLTIVQRVNFPDSSHPIPEGWEFTPHLVSCTQYPFNVSQYASGHTSNVIIGSWDSGVNSISLTSTQLAVQTIATFTLERKYNSFLDFSPYAQYQLYIPLCGWVDLPDQCVGKTVTVELATDVINNSCVATIKANECPVAHKTGHMGSSVAISVTENGLKQATLTNALFNTVGAITSTGYAVSTNNAIGIVNGITNVASSITQGNIANNSNYTRQVGTTSDKSDFHISNSCYFKATYAVPEEPTNYAHSIGYPCNKSGKLSDFSGYTICSDVDLSGLSCEQDTKDRIKRILETGFYA